MNVNIVVVGGNLTKDPELKYTPGGTAVVSFTVAVNRQYKKDGEVKKDTAFIRCVAWDKTAEILNQYKNKGDCIVVEGRIQTRSWEVEGKKNYATEVVANRIHFVGGQKKENGGEEKETDWAPPEE